MWGNLGQNRGLKTDGVPSGTSEIVSMQHLDSISICLDPHKRLETQIQQPGNKNGGLDHVRPSKVSKSPEFASKLEPLELQESQNH